MGPPPFILTRAHSVGGLAVPTAAFSAYCNTMASNYNSRYRPAEVLWINDEAHVIRARENFEDILRNQIELDAAILADRTAVEA